MADLLALGFAFLALALAAGAAVRVGLSVIPAYVLAGVAVGPFGVGAVGAPFVTADATLGTLAELGVVLLLFFLGVEFSVDRLLSAGRRLPVAGAVDLVANLGAGVALGLLFGWSPLEAVLLGGVVYISSSAIVTKSFIDLGWVANPEAEPVLGVLVVEDIVVAVYLTVVASLVGVGVDAGGDPLSRAAVALGFLFALALAVRYGAPLFERLFTTATDEQVVLRALAVTVPVAGAALALGASEAVAAFFVGTGVGATEHAERVEELLAPLRDWLAAVFFFVIGLATDPALLVAVAVPLTVVVAVTVPVKAASGYVAGRLYDLPPARSLRVGVGLVPRGEFSLVVAAVAATGSGRVMTSVIPAVAVGYVVVTSVVGTLLMDNVRTVERLVPGVD